jgi:photosystem II stability/assembly factor-like uncharacterized protein
MAITNKNVLTTRQGALWVQPDGPNTAVYFLGCHDLGDISEPKGSLELLRCMDKRGGWRTVGTTQAPPDAVSTSVEWMAVAVRDWLEKLNCEFTLFALQRTGGEPDIFTNYVRATILNNARVTSRTDSGIVHHEEESASMQSIDIEAWPPVVRTGTLTARRQTTSETLALNDVYTYSPLDCETGVKDGDKAIATADSSGYTGNVLQTENAGVTWAAVAADPFIAGQNILSGVAFPISDTVTRLLVAKQFPVGGQGQVAYSDDDGATWTTVSIGGATAAHGAVDSGALFAIDQGHVWFASAKGYIYFSSDGGATWTAQHAGTLTTEDVLSIQFEDENTGMASCADDVILKTTDGGETWELTSAVTGTGADLTCVAHSGDYWWVGTDTGQLFYSRDMGDTWTERTFSGSSVGNIADIVFVNELIGYAIHNSAAPVGEILVTINGGYSWKSITTPANNGLNALSIAETSMVYAVGEVESGTAVIVKITWD